MTTPNGEIPKGGRGYEDVAGLANAQPPALANPDTFDLAEAARGGFFGNILSGFLSIGAAIGQALDDIANALFGGLVQNDHPALDRIRDGQLALNEKIGLVELISGYGVAYMKANRYKDRGQWVLMEFDGQLGPVKNAELRDNGIALAEGTWVLDAQCTHDHHVDRLTSRIRIEVTKPDGTVYSVKDAYGEVLPNKWTTRQVHHTIVAPESGYLVRVWTYYNVGSAFGIYNRLLWRGGTALSHLSAHRLDNDTSNAVVEESVPTIGDSEGQD